ncbi:MAG TPA: hypothetical protein VMY37_22690 [Thermoguttaceae bacterium]|nr:hypothetical protein [Thermoguttaceae bacterium]
MAIRVASFRVVGSDGDWPAEYRELLDVADTLKRAVNLIWRTWLAYHDQHGSAAKLRAWRDEYTAWRTAQHDWEKASRDWKAAPRKPRGPKPAKPKGAKPLCPLFAVDKQCSKAIYRALHDAFPGVHGRILELQRQLTQKAIANLKPFQGSFPGWIRVLLLEDRPAFSSVPQPIPFDLKHCELVAPAPDAKGQNRVWKLAIRYRRLADGKSVSVSLRLDTKTRRGSKQAVILERIASGEYAFKGAKLHFDRRERRWYMKPGYEMPTPVKLEADADCVAYLQPAADRPWLLWIHGFPWYVGGKTGRHVFHTRRQLLTQRWSRQEGYRVASSSGKGHGKKRALDAKLYTLRRRWQDFTKTQNEAMVQDVLRLCARYGVGMVRYYQPVGAKRDSRFLGRAGKLPGRQDATNWDWYQAGKILNDKLTEVGVGVEIRKYGVE